VVKGLRNGETLELHHSPGLKEWQLNLEKNKKVKLFVLHKLCHQRVHQGEK